MVPPGNWCEIFKVVAACAVPVPKRRIAGAASADAMTCRRVIMGVLPGTFSCSEFGRSRCGMLARQGATFLSSDSLMAPGVFDVAPHLNGRVGEGAPSRRAHHLGPDRRTEWWARGRPHSRRPLCPPYDPYFRFFLRAA